MPEAGQNSAAFIEFGQMAADDTTVGPTPCGEGTSSLAYFAAALDDPRDSTSQIGPPCWYGLVTTAGQEILPCWLSCSNAGWTLLTSDEQGGYSESQPQGTCTPVELQGQLQSPLYGPFDYRISTS
jgi:hypothetical protein